MDKPGMQAAPAAAATGGEDDGTLPRGPPSAPRRGSAGQSAATVVGGGRLRGLTPQVVDGAGTVAVDRFAGEGRGPRRGPRRERAPEAASPPWRRGRETLAVADAKSG